MASMAMTIEAPPGVGVSGLERVTRRRTGVRGLPLGALAPLGSMRSRWNGGPPSLSCGMRR
ncbi:protein of unknown function (plasmid) [Candidatus Methylocalor cossyra]|uniref:Uncharacterized protein n=1 Tax=Candidatus Methylocalor cossyra TaxID=3108543 RepID=A0ABM9NMR8_9GAMM